jgi:hypothetical protein
MFLRKVSSNFKDRPCHQPGRISMTNISPLLALPARGDGESLARRVHRAVWLAIFVVLLTTWPWPRAMADGGGNLAPAAFAQLAPTEASAALHDALRRGALTYRSTSELLTWLRERPNAWRSDERTNPLNAYNSELPGLAPNAQAWLAVATMWVRPELATPPTGVRAGQEADAAKGERPVLPFLRLDVRAASVRGALERYPDASSVIAQAVRANLASPASVAAATPFTLTDPLAEFKLLVAVAHGSPRLVVDADQMRAALQGRSMWSPLREMEIGVDLLSAARDARDETTRRQLAFPATDAIIDGRAAFYRDHPTLNSTYGPMHGPTTWTPQEEPLLRDMAARFFERSALERCPNFGEDVLLVDFKPLKTLWVDRFASRTEALCLWYPTHWVPVDEIVANRPDVALDLVAHPNRPGDGRRREILLSRLERYLFTEADRSGLVNEGPVGLIGNAELGRAIRAEIWIPRFRLTVERNGAAIVHFQNAELDRAWRSRPARRQLKAGEYDTGTLSALLGMPENEIRALTDRLYKCRVGSVDAELWGSAGGPWRLARLACNRDVGSVLPLDSAAWPRDASDATAHSWLVSNDEPLILVDGNAPRLVWLPDRVMHNTALDDVRVVGVSDMGGRRMMVVQGTIGPRQSPARDVSIEVLELIEDVFSFPRSSVSSN